MYSQGDFDREEEQRQRQYLVQQQRQQQRQQQLQQQPPSPADYPYHQYQQQRQPSDYVQHQQHHQQHQPPQYQSKYQQQQQQQQGRPADAQQSHYNFASAQQGTRAGVAPRHELDYDSSFSSTPSYRRTGEQSRPVSSSPSTIIAMYSNGGGMSSSSSGAVSGDDYVGADTAVAGVDYAAVSHQQQQAHGTTSFDSDFSRLNATHRASAESATRRPLPQPPRSPHGAQATPRLSSPIAASEPTRPLLPPMPSPGEVDASSMYASPPSPARWPQHLGNRQPSNTGPSAQQAEAAFWRNPSPSTPSMSSAGFQPQTPPSWSPSSAAFSHAPPVPRRQTPTIRETPEPPSTEGSLNNLNRSKSFVGQTLISPGSAPSMPLPADHLRRMRDTSGETPRDASGRRPYEIPWDLSTTPDFLAQEYGGTETALPDATSDLAMLSNVAVLLRDAVPRAQQIKGSVAYPFSFTGKDVVSTLVSQIPEDKLAWAARCAATASERQIALCIAKSLKNQLFFHEVDWGLAELQDGVDDVYMFMEDSMGNHTSAADAFDQMTRSSDLIDLPTGIFTPMTACYSPLCGRPNAPANAFCYSNSCPRSIKFTGGYIGVGLEADDAAKAMAGLNMGASHNALAWADTVPADVLESLSKDEIKRQNAILELIQKEEEFLHDLELLDSLFLTRLLQSPAVVDLQSPLSNTYEREDFLREVFTNHTELIGHVRMLVERLHIRQREDGVVVGALGDVYLNAALEWGGAFEANMTGFPMAKHRILREAARNPFFASFLEDCRRDPACHRLPMDHFLQRATTRLPRYNLHFKSILKDTEESNSDRDSLTRAIELVDEQCKSIQKGVAVAETKVKIREYAYNLATKRNKVAIHMDLLNPERQLVHQGRVYRKQNFTEFEWQDLLAVLFDNYLVVTKTKKREEGDRSISRFVLEKRPIAVEMMQLMSFTDPPISRTLGLSNFHIRSDRENRDLYPFTIGHIAGKIDPLTLYVSSKSEREEWKARIEEAIGLRTAVQEANKLFEIWPMSSDFFALPPPNSVDPERAPPGVNASEFRGVITCAVPFQTRDGRQLIAIGCADGVWIGLRNDAKSLRKVLHLKLVMQCAVLDSFGIFVVLADKVLISYSLDALVPSATSPTNPRPPQKLSGNRDVMFFAVGVVKERTLLVYMKKKPNESVFRALEPVANATGGGAKNEQHKTAGHGSSFFNKFGKDNKSSEWFREFKTFFIPSEAYAMQFLRAKLCIVCARGFEIIDLDNLIPGTIPDFSLSSREDARVYTLSRRVETARPLGMFKNREGEFLLCYDGFACFVDRRGSPIKLEQVIEWEGVPQSVAFKEPFILAFDARFIEVRDSVSGQLVQLIRANDLRNITFTSSTTFDEEQALIMTQRLRSPQRRTHDYQQVFELIGTSMYQHHVRPFATVRSPSSSGGAGVGGNMERNGSFSGQFYGDGGGPPSAGGWSGTSSSTALQGSNVTMKGNLQRQGTTATTSTNYTTNSNSSSLGNGKRGGPWI